jgi:hypothetical protein
MVWGLFLCPKAKSWQKFWQKNWHSGKYSGNLFFAISSIKSTPYLCKCKNERMPLNADNKDPVEAAKG